MGKVFDEEGRELEPGLLKECASGLLPSGMLRSPREKVTVEEDGSKHQHKELIHDSDGGVAGWTTDRGDGAIHTTLTPRIPHSTGGMD